MNILIDTNHDVFRDREATFKSVVREHCLKMGIPFIDLSAALPVDAVERKLAFLPYDGHFSPQGSTWVAKFIAEYRIIRDPCSVVTRNQWVHSSSLRPRTGRLVIVVSFLQVFSGYAYVQRTHLAELGERRRQTNSRITSPGAVRQAGACASAPTRLPYITEITYHSA